MTTVTARSGRGEHEAEGLPPVPHGATAQAVGVRAAVGAARPPRTLVVVPAVGLGRR